MTTSHRLRTVIAICLAFFVGVHFERGDLFTEPFQIFGLVIAIGLAVVVAFPEEFTS